MSDEREKQVRFYAEIRATLARHPDWLSGALLSVSGGMADALAACDRQRADNDLALRAALILSNPGRITKATREALAASIIKVIDRPGQCAAEATFLKKHKP